ncbi:tyrosine-protein phosphatase [Paenarthrobacter ureafaciens]
MAVLNLRPLAGGRILRGSQPFGLDAAGTSNFLEQHGIQAIMDLRSDLERSIVPWLVDSGADGSFPPAGTPSRVGTGAPSRVEVIHNPLDPNAVAGSLQAVETPEDLGELYLGWLRVRPQWVADALRPVAQGRRTLVHCSLGKDRTGVVSAVALMAAGASDEAVVNDYTATTANLPDVLKVMADTLALARSVHPGPVLQSGPHDPAKPGSGHPAFPGGIRQGIRRCPRLPQRGRPDRRRG